MLLKDIFRNHGYRSLLDNKIADNLNLFIEIFQEDEAFPQELKEIYISQKNDEVFFVLDPMNLDISQMSDFWNRKISSFLIFGSNDKDILNKIKYNITQIILDYTKIEDKNLESSLTISRKIFVPCLKDKDNNYYIEEKDVFLLPFILVEPGDYHPDESMVKKLKECLPTDSTLDFLDFKIKKVKKIKTDNSIKKSLDENQFKMIRGWLEK
ncbi:hypothetical protein Ccar_05670 [Clostridium carboxidivorans P7]|uniref:Uncharacterized protein n=1 Tax=Clostridium carboxidivorans P7 TaxID=536227 RepID=C6PPQ6_9CLOT|nr:hypothetical protein [Clostridium carboxidivorans]AKN30336.1 hypothetical protein Ccar_05670 [Clostridium carboxidivorans P7]EET88786.1 hypothetical protein CcarbDRAFT_0773 [Clostridium carboxidivorans P7]